MNRTITAAAFATVLIPATWWAISNRSAWLQKRPPLAQAPAAKPVPAKGAFSPQPESGEVLRADFPPEQVFTRALWRRPDPADRILHAVRQEWSDQDGVSRWRFFLAILPGPELRQWLATNPFSLANTDNFDREMPDPPDWFPPSSAGHTLQQSTTGNLIILTNTSDGVVYLADHGKGFTRSTRISTPP